jgi:hypothetical protein
MTPEVPSGEINEPQDIVFIKKNRIGANKKQIQKALLPCSLNILKRTFMTSS